MSTVFIVKLKLKDNELNIVQGLLYNFLLKTSNISEKLDFTENLG